MKNITLLLLLISFACKNDEPGQAEVLQIPFKNNEKKIFKEGDVFADNRFDGARLSDFSKINDSTFQATIRPENTPVNNSPWYGFRLWSNRAIDISLEILYTEHRHRYIPKISFDGSKWDPLDAEYYEIDSVNKKATLFLQLTSDTLWVAAQEVISSNQIDSWLASLEGAPFIQKIEVGKSVLGKPINLLKINEGEGKQTLVLVGRQHPPEVPGGTIALMSFVETVLSGSALAMDFRKRFEILVFPLLNPDGVDMGNWRHNANGVDLNRDWESFTQPETKAVRNWINQRKDDTKRNYCFGIDFHTSYSGPYLLVIDTVANPINAGITDNWIHRIEQAWSGQSLDIRPRSQKLPYCYNWMINEVGIEAVTYEEGDEIDRETVRKRAAIYATKLMETLMEKYP
ncbi:M14 family metallopeptidase [Fulvivirgaceae bacterium BMA10]|uniref:M14 family metallopeptidase n=1 Tax=Splendidivirga corallicola TaxID=3051826 RepID=A0ABT8KSQ1_9BACT|nr:M14 family metallopeptidase [Fulvivirgaceae bacterium BMA10]